MGASAGEISSFVGSFALSLLSLGVVSILAYVALRWLSKHTTRRGVGPIQVMARCPLEPRRAVYLLEVGGRGFLVGVGDGAIAMLAEVDPATVRNLHAEMSCPTAGEKFAKLVAGIRKKEKP